MMSRFSLIVTVLAAAFAMAFATAAFAQQMGGGTQQKERRSAAVLQRTAPRTGQHQLSPRQRERIMRIRAHARQQTQRIQANRKLSQNQKDRKTEQVWMRARRDIRNVLTPQQRQQFRSWWQGKGELTDQELRQGSIPVGAGPGMVTKPAGKPGVNLTADQKAKISHIRSNMMDEIKKIQGNSSLTAQQRNEKIMAARKSAREEIMNLLTPEQKKQLATKVDSWIK